MSKDTIEVEAPDGSVVEFPATMTPEQIHAVMKANYGNAVSNGQKLEVDRSGAAAGLDATVRGIARGATGNFADEIASAGNAVLPLDRLTGKPVASIYDGDGFFSAFNKNMAMEHSTDVADDDQSPVLSGTGKLAGVVGGTVLGGRGVTAALETSPRLMPLVARMEVFLAGKPLTSVALKAAAGGGAYGAAAGAGEGDTLGNRARSAGGGAVVGAGLGAVGGPIIAKLGPAIANYGKVLFGKGVTQTAVAQLMKALQHDGYDVTTPEGLGAVRHELARYTGRPVTIADLGSNLRARAGVGMRAPSGFQQQAEDAMAARTAGAPNRIVKDIQATVAPRIDIHGIDESLVAQRGENALPLRNQALYQPTAAPVPDATVPTLASPAVAPPAPIGLTTAAPVTPPLARPPVVGLDSATAPVPAVPGPALPSGQLAAVPGPQGPVLSRTPIVPDDEVMQNLARLELIKPEVTAAQKASDADFAIKTAKGEAIDPTEMVNLLDPDRPLAMHEFDIIKKRLDAEITAGFKSPDASVRARAGQLRTVRDELRSRMRKVGGVDGADGPYGQYLDSYRTSSDFIDALRSGRGPAPGEPKTTPGFDALDPERISINQADRTPAEQEFYRVGAARRLADKARETRFAGNPAANVVPSPEAASQIEALGGGAPDLLPRVQLERNLARLPAEVQGSQTAARQAAEADASSGLEHLPGGGSSVGVLTSLLRAAGRHINVNRNAAVNEQLLPRLLETDPAAIERNIQELVMHGKVMEAARLRRAQTATTVSKILGLEVGGPMALNNGDR